MILKLSKDKKLTFYRKNPIYIGEKDFDIIEVLISPTIDGNEINELNFILHLVNKNGEYLHIDLDKEIKEDIIIGSTQITTDITSVAQKFSVYIEMIRGNDEVIGKTNVLEIEVNPLPDEQGEIIPEEIERRSTIISQDNPPESSHKKYKLNALWINYTDKTQFVLTSIDESQAPEKYVYTWERNNNHVIVSTEVAPEYTPDNVDYQYSNGDMWIQIDSETDKIVSISACTGYTKELIDNETWRYNYTWAILNSGVTNYNELNNKPQINSVTLSGNMSSDNLGLQKKLTAGENITISDNNVISAKGGSNDYTDLENKPSINNVTLSGNKTSDDLSLQGKLTAGNNITIEGNTISATDTADYTQLSNLPKILYRENANVIAYGDLIGKLEPQGGIYFTKNNEGYYIQIDPKTVFTVRRYDEVIIDNLAKEESFVLTSNSFIDLPNFANRNSILVQYADNASNSGNYVQFLYWRDSNGKLHTAQRINTKRTLGTWEEVSSGVRVVSGVVNQNGTITFTDSDGNTFTTGGSSVIGSDGFSPVAAVISTASGATISITDSTGTTTADIANGSDYVLTQADKVEIAQMAVDLLPNADTVSY